MSEIIERARRILAHHFKQERVKRGLSYVAALMAQEEDYTGVAQLEERSALDAEVGGSSPPTRAKCSRCGVEMGGHRLWCLLDHEEPNA